MTPLSDVYSESRQKSTTLVHFNDVKYQYYQYMMQNWCTNEEHYYKAYGNFVASVKRGFDQLDFKLNSQSLLSKSRNSLQCQ